MHFHISKFPCSRPLQGSWKAFCSKAGEALQGLVLKALQGESVCQTSFSLGSMSRAKPRGGSDPQWSVWRGQATTENGVQLGDRRIWGSKAKKAALWVNLEDSGSEKEGGVRGGKVESEACFSGLVPGSLVPNISPVSEGIIVSCSHHAVHAIAKTPASIL